MTPLASTIASADEPTRQNDPIYIARASTEISIDGELDDAAWIDAPVVETWWETNVADNVVPEVQNRAWLLYDDRVPLSSIRYSGTDWRVLIYRNYPRDH